MRRSILRHVAWARSARFNGAARYSQQHDLEKLYKLKQPHELPKNHRARGWNDDTPLLSTRIAFGALGLAMVGTVVYAANRYYTLRPSAKRILDKDNFLSFTLASKETVTSDCSIFTLLPNNKVKSAGDPYERLWISPVWSVQAKQPQLQIARSYTPLPPNQPYVSSDPNAGALRFLIREETNGEMSGYLHRLGVGAIVELRGPQLECNMPKDLDEIVFFAGGTGIAPALQVANYLSKIPLGSGKTPRMRLIWSSRRREDCAGGINDTEEQARSAGGWSGISGVFKATQPGVESQQQSVIVRELERLKAQYAGRLEVDYFVDEENTFVDAAVVRRHLSDPPKTDPTTYRKAIMISGPDGFIKHLAGAKVWANGQEQQGQLGGLLQGTVQPHWTVIKL